MLKLGLLSARLNPAAWLNKPWLDSAQAQACSISKLSLLQVRPLLFLHSTSASEIFAISRETQKLGFLLQIFRSPAFLFHHSGLSRLKKRIKVQNFPIREKLKFGNFFKIGTSTGFDKALKNWHYKRDSLFLSGSLMMGPFYRESSFYGVLKFQRLNDIAF